MLGSVKRIKENLFSRIHVDNMGSYTLIDRIKFQKCINIMKGCDNIFNNLIDFGYQRSTKEAIGFYIAYLFLVIIIGVIIGLLLAFALGAMIQNNIYNYGLIIGKIVAIVVSLGVSFLILKEKNMLGNSGFILIALLSGLLAIFLGGLGGLIPAAYLTTIPANSK